MPKKNSEKKRGAPKGHIGNPSGKNQYAAARGHGVLAQKPIAVRLPDEYDKLLRQLAEKQGVSVGDLVREAIVEWYSSHPNLSISSF